MRVLFSKEQLLGQSVRIDNYVFEEVEEFVFLSSAIEIPALRLYE